MGELARSLDVKLAFDPMEVFPGNNEEHALTPEESRRLFGEIGQLKKRGYGVLNSHEYLGHFANRLDYSCAQPKVFIRVSEDGKVQPFWCSKASMTLGDLRRQSLGEILDSNPFREFSEVASGCSSCVNSSTVEASIFYSARHFLMNPYSYLRFILDYAI